MLFQSHCTVALHCRTAQSHCTVTLHSRTAQSHYTAQSHCTVALHSRTTQLHCTVALAVNHGRKNWQVWPKNALLEAVISFFLIFTARLAMLKTYVLTSNLEIWWLLSNNQPTNKQTNKQKKKWSTIVLSALNSQLPNYIRACRMIQHAVRVKLALTTRMCTVCIWDCTMCTWCHICNLASWANHVLISWSMNQQKATEPRTQAVKESCSS